MLNMESYQWTQLGLLLEIFGLFFLSVQAITLPKFRALRDLIFVPLHHALRPTQVTFVDRELTKDEELEFRKAFLYFYLSHSITGIIGTVFLFFLMRFIGFDLWSYMLHVTNLTLVVFFLLFGSAVALFTFAIPVIVILTSKASFRVFFAVALLTTLFPVTLVFMAVGEVFHQLSILFSKAIIAGLNFIDNNTQDGTIGLIGFSLAAVGCIFQILGALP